MNRKLSPGGLFRRLFTCPSAPEVSNISDSSDEVPTQKLVTKPRGRLKKRKEKDERFRSVADLQFSQEFQENSQRLSTSENQLSGRVFFLSNAEIFIFASGAAGHRPHCYVIGFYEIMETTHR